MKHISILVHKDAVLAAVDDPRHMFMAANEFLAGTGKQPMFDVQMVSATKEVQLHRRSFTVHIDALLKDIKKTDMVIVPAIAGDFDTVIDENKELLKWIVKQQKNGAEIVSLCTGAFMLAATGLLKGRQSSTHWMFANQFRKMYPDTVLVEGKIITDECGIYTSGGATSYWNLLLYLIEKFTDRETAIMAAKYFVIDIDRTSQSPFMIFNGQKEHEDEPIIRAQEYIEANFHDKINVDQLAASFAIGRRNFERRFKKATSNTVMEYIQRVKIEAAKKSLESSRDNVNEVVYNVGYSDPKAFRTTFKKLTGLSPLQYRAKYYRHTPAFG